MITNSLLIIFDRGSLKAWRVDETPNRPEPALRLIQSFEITDAHGRYEDKLTDQAGRFPVGTSGPGRHQGAHAERQHLELENDRRILKQLAGHITDIVTKEQPEGWTVAAPAEINSSVIDQLAPAVRDRIVENVPSDLTRLEQAKLASHFTSLASVK